MFSQPNTAENLSVLICTSVDRETQLSYCLESLKLQSLAVASIIISDDGSESGQVIAEKYQRDLPITYIWRKSDQCPARTRNLAALRADSEYLLFIDSDILLNPQALAAYCHYLKEFPSALLYGYVGCDLNLSHPSYLFNQVDVNWMDKRFLWTEKGLQPRHPLFHSPYENAFAGNFAISKAVFEQVNGFDEGFIGWGGEDLDFAERAVQLHKPIHFILDAWGEHQVHKRDSEFHQVSSELRGRKYEFRPHSSVAYQVEVIASLNAKLRLDQIIRDYYLR